MKMKIYIIILTLSFLLIPRHFAAAQTVFSFTGPGTTDILHYGYSSSSVSFLTNTDWATDTINMITTSPEASSVLDQHVYSDPAGTRISRNALFIGQGSIDTSSTYYGSNVPGGENSISGISLAGDTYGALIQNGSLEFSATFGGIRESVAMAAGNSNTYSVEQFGFVDADGLGTFTPQEDSMISVDVSGDYYSATIATFDFGSVPQPAEPDILYAEIRSWATGIGTYSYTAATPATEVSTGFDFGYGTITTTFDADALKSWASFDAN